MQGETPNDLIFILGVFGKYRTCTPDVPLSKADVFLHTCIFVNEMVEILKYKNRDGENT